MNEKFKVIQLNNSETVVKYVIKEGRGVIEKKPVLCKTVLLQSISDNTKYCELSTFGDTVDEITERGWFYNNNVGDTVTIAKMPEKYLFEIK